MRNFKPPQPVGQRVYLETAGGTIRVPMRETKLREPNPPVRRYDTSGPYGDAEYEIDPERRFAFVTARDDDARAAVRAMLADEAAHLERTLFRPGAGEHRGWVLIVLPAEAEARDASGPERDERLFYLISGAGRIGEGVEKDLESFEPKADL